MSLTTRQIKIMLLVLLAVVWAFPLLRWGQIFQEARTIAGETHSINADNDVRWNEWVGSGYLMTLVATAFAIGRFDRDRIASWLGALAGLGAAVFFNFMSYDGLIIIAPMGNSGTPLWLGCGVAIYTLVITVVFPRRRLIARGWPHSCA
jgi:hypothetical protein